MACGDTRLDVGNNMGLMKQPSDTAPLPGNILAGSAHSRRAAKPGQGLLAAARGWLLGLYGHFHSFHSFGPPRLKYMGWVGVLGFISFYFLRFTRPNPDPFDDLELRVIVLVLSLGAALKDHWPQRLKRYYLPWTYVTLLVGLPFFSVYVGLERGGGVVSMSNCFIAMCFLTLLVDWRNLIAMLVMGITAAVALFQITSPDQAIPRDLLAQLPAFALIGFAGYLFKYSTEQVEHERKLLEQQAHNERRIAALGDTLGFVAHELNTPLATVRGCVTVLRQRYQSVSPEQGGSNVVQMIQHSPHEIMQVLERSERAALYCQTLISRFVQSAKEASPGAVAPPVTASELITALLTEYPFDESERRWVSSHVDADFLLNGRRDLLYLVFCSITKNALQALRDEPSQSLEITASVTSDVETEGAQRGWIRFSDNGHGVPSAVLEKLTNEPVTTRADDGGSGMGLLFCRRVMESAGGALHITSELGKGTTVILEFDLKREPV